MALQLEKETAAGVKIAYWAVNPTMAIDFENKIAYATVVPYVSAATKAASKKSVDAMEVDGFDEARRVTLEGAEFDAAIVTGDLRAAVYAALKAKDFFAGATDV